jgi:uncharacterized membrane protein
MNKPVKIAFTASLILNVLLIGFEAGKVFHGDHEAPPWQKTKEALAPETIDFMKTTFKGKKEEVLPLFMDVHKKKKAMKDILIAPDFDGDAYDVLVAEFKAVNDKLIDGRMEITKILFSQLSQEERAKLAEHIVEKMMGNPPHERSERRSRRGRDQHFSHPQEGEAEHVMRKAGAIEAQRGRAIFDSRELQESDTNPSE